MGRRDRKPRGQIIHRSKLFGGVVTAAEVHARHGFRQPCAIQGCSNLPVIAIKMLMLHDEFVKQSPLLAAEIARTNPSGPYIPCIDTTFGKMVMVSKTCACRTHQADAEKAAAKAPSWVLVEIDRGPGADKPVVQVGAQIEA
jgi:hypothetical protein